MKKIDSIVWLKRDRELINNKRFLNLIYKDFYTKLKPSKLPKPIVEIGSGGGFIKKIIPGVITTDVVISDGIDIKAFAEKLPFKSRSIGSIVMINVFHHIKDPTKALREFERTLKPKGKIVMIEPWVTTFSKFIYQNFHHENFDPSSD
jgi:SAM-dependent methyltransferase